MSVALLLGVSMAEEKAKQEETKPVEASKKQDKRGIFDHDFGGHDFGGSSHSSFSSHDFGSHGHEIHHHEPEHHDFHHHEHHPVHEKVVTVVKKVPVPGKNCKNFDQKCNFLIMFFFCNLVPHVKEVHVPHVKEVHVPYEVKVPKPYPVIKHVSLSH
jgi:hypothetical protein